MSRKPFIHSNRFPYHICARSNFRAPFPGNQQFNWQTFSAELYLQCTLHNLKVHAFVLMPNHFHLLATSPEAPVSDVVRNYLSAVTRIVNTRNKDWGRLFGGRYHWTLVDSPLYYAHALKYVYRNPVKAGLCEEVQQFEFSTLFGLTGASPLTVPITAPKNETSFMVPGNGEIGDPLLNWLNTPHRAEINVAIRGAFKKKAFRMPVDRKTRKRIELDSPV